MAVDSYTYGTVVQVQRLVGDLAPGRVFTATSQPSLADVESILDDIATEVHAELSLGGYPVETKATLDSSYPRAAGWLANINSLGAAMRLSDTEPGEATPNFEIASVQTRLGRIAAQYKAGLDKIKGSTLEGLGLPRSSSEGLSIATPVTTNSRFYRGFTHESDLRT